RAGIYGVEVTLASGQVDQFFVAAGEVGTNDPAGLPATAQGQFRAVDPVPGLILIDATPDPRYLDIAARIFPNAPRVSSVSQAIAQIDAYWVASGEVPVNVNIIGHGGSDSQMVGGGYGPSVPDKAIGSAPAAVGTTDAFINALQGKIKNLKL